MSKFGLYFWVYLILVPALIVLDVPWWGDLVIYYGVYRLLEELGWE